MVWNTLRSLSFGFVIAFSACATTGSVRSNLQVSDAWINTRAENEIQQLTGPDDHVAVHTQKGVVYLDGTVRTVAKAESIEQRVTAVQGVREVKNNLRVTP